MVKVFDIFGRIVSNVLGLILVGAGIIWILQAFDLAFNTPLVPGGPVSFMVNNHQWALYGAVAVAVGGAQVIWSNTRRRAS
jgi:hypothetical protein